MPKHHRKHVVVAILAENLKTLMKSDANLATGPKVAKASGVSRKSINNITKSRHDPHLSSVEAIAKAFKIETYQLLAPGIDENLLAIYRAYRETDDGGKNLLGMAADTVLKARERKTRRTGTE